MPHRRAGRKPRPKRARRAPPDFPPEIWALVVAISGRQSTGRLCAVSHRFYSIFTPLLYGTTTNPALSGAQSDLLLRTLGDAHESTLSPNPASVVQTLAVPWFGRGYRRLETREGLAALRNLVGVSLEGEPMRGSALRALEWNVWEGTKQLAKFLGTPGHFPNLKEISVKCKEGAGSLALLQIPNLEKIGCSLELSPGRIRTTEYDARPPSWNALGKALKRLPSSSPLLQALNLKLEMYGGWTWDNHTGLVKTINQIRFPALTTVELTVTVLHFAARDPAADFSPFLLGHPALTSVTLNLDGMRIPTVEEGAYVPRLRSFTGSVPQCAAISACAPELEELSLVFPFVPQRVSDDAADPDPPPPPGPSIPEFFPPNVSPSVKRLNLRAINKHDLNSGCDVSPDSLTCLALAFPNITHLDLYLTEQTSPHRDGFAGFRALEHLRIRERKHVDFPYTHRRKPARFFFPLKKYAPQLTTALPSLPRLSRVDFLLLADRSIDEDSLGCPCCDEGWKAPWVPNSLVEYRFGVDRKGGDAEAELVLVGQSVSEES
ncbi:hypothetical protein FB451DRAFT_1275021 [Mycena latifolia]|nr:hypothetical protein FB451DRAFT_1275021 [Mycena latifolia]